MRSILAKSLVVLAFFLTFAACNQSQKRPESLKIKIIQTTDVHGAIFPNSLKNGGRVSGSLARVYHYVQQQRQKADQEVILLDNGDIMQGSPAVYYSNFVRTDTTNIVSQVLNFMRYDAATVGNHDIETGHPVYDKFAAELQFPWMAANAIELSTEKPYFTPYTVIERQGVRIAVLGLITPGIPNWLPEKMYEGMRFDDMIESAKRWVKIIQEKEKPDLVVGLFHSGVDPTYGGADPNSPKNENASRLVAEQVPGLDVVFAGHDHREHNLRLENSAGKPLALIDPMSHAQKVGVAEFDLKLDESGKLYKKKLKSYIVDISDVRPDSSFMYMFKPFYKEVERYVNKPIGVMTKTIEAKDALFGPSEFIDLIHTAQLELTGADISLVSPLSLYASIDSGRIYVRDMFELYKYENYLYTMQFTGQEVKDALEWAAGVWFNQMKSDKDLLLNFVRDEKGNLVKSSYNEKYTLKEPFFNFDSGAGIIYTVDVTKPVGERINIKSMADGTPFDPKKTYKVAVNSYRGNGGGHHFTKGAGIPHADLPKRLLHTTETDLRYNIIEWIESKKHIEPEKLNHWKIIPEDLVKKTKVRSRKLLLGR